MNQKGEEQVLTEDQINELSEIILNIENHYGFPCDIEWAFEEGKFYVVQSRPITTIKNKNNTNDKYSPNNYSRMFSGKGFAFILSDLFLSFYKELDVLSVFDGNTWMSLIPKNVVKETQKEGKKLYESKEKFESYKKDFYKYIKTCKEKAENILNKEEITLEDVNIIFDLTREHFYYYRKTEFFYTDLVDYEKMIPSVKEFDKLKLDGRSHLNKIIFEENGYINTLANKISEKFNLDKKVILQMSADEIKDLFINNKKKDLDINDRMLGYFQSGNSLMFGKEGKKKAESFIKQYQQAGDVIKGTTANGGCIRAKAFVVIPDVSNFESIVRSIDNMKKGEVLVAETTSPEIIHACEKASAIITNQGGMLSHAAIISRELNIPCIIGTDKDVLENIKMGDEVEVDADNGVVKILNKAENNDIYKKIRNFDNWLEDGRWIQPPLVWGMFTHWGFRESTKKISKNTDIGTIFTVDGYAFHEKKNFDNLKVFLKKEYENNELNTLAKNIDKQGKKLFSKIQKYLKKDNVVLKESFKDFFETYLDFIGFWTATTVIGNLAVDVAKEEGYVDSEADLFGKVHPYLKKSWIEEEVEDINKIANFCIKKDVDENDIKVQKLLAEYRNKYIWSKISKWSGEEYSKEDAISRLKEEIKNIKECNNIKGEKKKGKTSDGVVNISVISAFYRAQATMIEMSTAYRLREILNEIADQNSVTYHEVILLTPNELLDLFEKNDFEIKNIEEVKKREGSFMCLLDGDEEKIITKDEDFYKEIYGQYIKSKENNIQEDVLKGIGASKGKVTAKVRVVNSAKDFPDFEEGEILVSVETSPTFVPLMRKASAILTGRGGVTSHAAIVSRELQKPCIIAIKDVVSILKTGDMVEVDADNGIVKVIKHDQS